MKPEIKAIRAAIKKVMGGMLGNDIDNILDKSVWDQDPYGWSKGAVATVSLEYGLPYALEIWMLVSDELASRNLFCEHVNNAVLAVHRS